jgi:hypothetical protein
VERVREAPAGTRAGAAVVALLALGEHAERTAALASVLELVLQAVVYLVHAARLRELQVGAADEQEAGPRAERWADVAGQLAGETQAGAAAVQEAELLIGEAAQREAAVEMHGAAALGQCGRTPAHRPP